MELDRRVLSEGERIVKSEGAPLRAFALIAGAGVLMYVLLAFVAAFIVRLIAPFVSAFAILFDGPERIDVGLVNLALLGCTFLAVLLTCGEMYFLRNVLTDRRLIVQTGFLQRTVRTCSLERLQDVTVHQDLLDRALGMGRITVETAGTEGSIKLRLLLAPLEWSDLIHRASRDAHERADAARAQGAAAWPDAGEVARSGAY